MKAACVIPAYNEEGTIGNVIDAVKAAGIINSIIVVSDGSTDKTSEVSRVHGAITIELKENRGKGAAMKTGIDFCNEDIILFLDADLLGLTKEHVAALVAPVISDKADMTVGIFQNGRFLTDLAQKVAPYLSGQRAMKRSTIKYIHDFEITRYGIETALTRAVKRNNLRLLEVKLSELTHVMKEEKLGLIHGFGERMKMYWQIVKCIKM